MEQRRRSSRRLSRFHLCVHFIPSPRPQDVNRGCRFFRIAALLLLFVDLLASGPIRSLIKALLNMERLAADTVLLLSVDRYCSRSTDKSVGRILRVFCRIVTALSTVAVKNRFRYSAVSFPWLCKCCLNLVSIPYLFAYHSFEQISATFAFPSHRLIRRIF